MTRPPLYPFQSEDIKILLAQLEDRDIAVSHHEQGLGKSRMSIEVAGAINARRLLVLCPAIARISWAIENDLWSDIPRQAIIIKGSADIKKLAKAGPDAIVTCTYDLCRNPMVREKLREFGFDFAILDEFQQVRSAKAKRTSAVYDRKIGVLAKIPKIMIMSGTPVVSWPMDLWTHLKRFAPHRIKFESGTVMTDQAFLKQYHVTKTMPNPHSRYAPPLVRIIKAQNLDDLHRRLEGWAIRRRKTDVLKDLPPMVTRTWPVAANRETREKLMQGLAEQIPAALLVRLENATTEEEMNVLMREVAASSAHVAAIQRLTGMAKAAAIADNLKAELAESVYKIGIFAWNLDVIDVLKTELAKYQPLVISGSTSHKGREDAVRLFQSDPAHRVFIGQISACGTALTLTAASRCVFAQVSWTPGENAQAAARFHRIGQKDSVDVRFAYLSGSLDEAMMRVLTRKSEAAWSVVDA